MSVGETWFFLLMYVKSYRAAILLACDQFIGGPFPWKRMDLARQRGERQNFKAKQGDKSESCGRPGWQAPGSLRLGGQRPSGPVAQEPRAAPRAPWAPEREQVLCSEDLYTWWDRRKKITYWWIGKCGASFRAGMWLSKLRYVGSVSLNPYLAPDSICSSYCKTNTWQEAVN